MRFHRDIQSPVGPLRVVADEDALVAILFLRNGKPADESPEGSTPVLDAAIAQLGEYFAGKRTTFELPLRPEGTDFQRAVWHALGDIELGETCADSDIARAVGRPDAVRAVGAANGQNPISIVIPCHRVIGKNGTLTGYGGGLENKRWLLDHEKPSLFRAASAEPSSALRAKLA